MRSECNALDFLIKENSPKIDFENLSMLLSMYIKKNHANKFTPKENNNENNTNHNHTNYITIIIIIIIIIINRSIC